MGMFDHFEPVPALTCSRCGATLRGWQGKHEGQNQFLWRQGEAAPVDQIVDEQWKLPPDRLAAERLPATFEIYTGCACGRWVVADCTCRGEAWAETRTRKDPTIDED